MGIRLSLLGVINNWKNNENEQKNVRVFHKIDQDKFTLEIILFFVLPHIIQKIKSSEVSVVCKDIIEDEQLMCRIIEG